MCVCLQTNLSEGAPLFNSSNVTYARRVTVNSGEVSTTDQFLRQDSYGRQALLQTTNTQALVGGGGTGAAIMPYGDLTAAAHIQRLVPSTMQQPLQTMTQQTPQILGAGPLPLLPSMTLPQHLSMQQATLFRQQQQQQQQQLLQVSQAQLPAYQPQQTLTMRPAPLSQQSNSQYQNSHVGDMQPQLTTMPHMLSQGGPVFYINGGDMDHSAAAQFYSSGSHQS